MTTRGLYVFKHDSELGNAPAHKLFELIQVTRRDRNVPARSIADYSVEAPPAGQLADYPGVELQILV